MRNELKKSFMILMVLLVLIISISAISAVNDDSVSEALQTNDIELDDTLEVPADAEIISDEGDKTFTDLNNDISTKDEINMTENYVYSSTDSLPNGITVNKEVTINGNGKTINPNGNLLFKIGTNGILTLNDMTIVNSYTKPDAMIQNSGKLILNNVTFTVERHILSSASSGSKFITIQNDKEMTVKDSNFKNSYIYSDNINKGNQISIYGLIYNKDTITIEDTIFDNNTLYNPPEAILGRTIDICAVLHNANNGNMLLKNIIIQNTNVSYTPYNNQHFEGIVFNEKGNIEIDNSIIKDNAIYFNLGASTNDNMVGVIYNEYSTGKLLINNTIIANNSNIQTITEREIITNKGIATLNNNYWGTNTPDLNKLIRNSGTSVVTNLTNFVIIDLDQTPVELIPGEEKIFEITVKLNESGEVSTFENAALPIILNSERFGTTAVELNNGVGHYRYLPITSGNDTLTLYDKKCTIVVNSIPDGSFTELNNLISENSEVNLYKNYIYTSGDSSLQNGITIKENKDVTINGNGYTINSTDAARLFNIEKNGKLTLKNVTLIADYDVTSDVSGKANIVNVGTLILDNVVLTSTKTSTGDYVGATILNKGNLNIVDSELIDSTIKVLSENPYQYFGLIYNNQGTVTIENTLIGNNKITKNGDAKNGYGIIYSREGRLTLTNVNVVDNDVNGNGIIYFGDEYSLKEMTITNCNFENTKATMPIYVSLGKVTITNSIFADNKNGAIYSKGILTVLNSTFKNNAENEKPLISALKSTTIQNSIFDNNNGLIINSTAYLNANNNYWGTNAPDFATLIYGTSPDNYAIMVIDGEKNIIPESVAEYNITFKTNDTNEICQLPDYTVDLEAINKLSANTLTITDGKATVIYTAGLDELNDTLRVIGNSQEKSTLEIVIKEYEKGTYVQLDRIVRKDQAEVDLFKDYTFDADMDVGFENGIVINKNVVINGHGHKINSTALAKLFNVESTGNLTLNDVILVSDYVKTDTYNNARSQSSFKNLGTVTLNNVTFTINQNVTSTNKALAAGIYNAAKLTILNSKFIDSKITTNTAYCFGLLDNNRGTLTIKNTIFDNNSVNDVSTETSVNVNGLIYNMGTLTFDDVNVTNNHIKTPNEGYGLIRGYTNSNINVINSRFEDNIVESSANKAYGNAIYASTGSITIKNSKFINNTGATSGGAIYYTSATGVFTNNTFERNNATSLGGAIYSEKSTTYINNLFKENKAGDGGAIYSKAYLETSKFTKNTFIENEATNIGGGALHITSTTTSVIDNCSFINNKATGEGSTKGLGGAAYTSSGLVTITKSIFIGNTANDGAAAYVKKAPSSSYTNSITNSIFENNVVNSPTGVVIFYTAATSSSAKKSITDYNYWGTNTPDFDKLILNGPTPANYALLVIDGKTALTDSEVYFVIFKNNDTGDTIELPDYEVTITSNKNIIIPTSLVIRKGEGTFEYKTEQNGTDTINVLSNGNVKASLDITINLAEGYLPIPEFTIVANNVTYGDALDLTFDLIYGPSGENLYYWTIFSDYGMPMESGFIDMTTKQINYKNAYSAGNYTIQVKISDVEGWNNKTVSDTFSIKQKTVEVIPTVKINDDNSVEITVNIQADGQSVNATGEVNTTIDTIYRKDVEEGIATINTNVLTNGTYTIVLTYTGDVNYLGKEISTPIIIKNIVSEDSLDLTGANNTLKPTFVIQLPKDAKGNLTVTIGNITKTKALENGSANITFDNLEGGEQTAIVNYTGDENYNSLSKTTTIFVLKTPEFSIAAGNVTYGDKLNFTFTITNGPTGSGIYKWAIASIFGLTLENGTLDSETKEIDYKNTYNVGTYRIIVSMRDVEGWDDLEVVDTFEVKQKETTITPTVKLNDDNTVTITAIVEADGVKVNASGIIFAIVDSKYNKTVEDGQVIITTNVLAPNTYEINISYTGDANYKESSVQTSILVREVIPENAMNVTVPEGNDTPSFSINLTNATGNLTVIVDGKDKYTKELENGSATITIDKLSTGKHEITVSYTGDDKYNPITKTTTTTIKEVVPDKALDVTVPEGTDSPSFSIYLPNATGNLTVIVDGKDKYTKELVNGSATVTVPKLSPGSHTIDVTYTGDDNYKPITKTTTVNVAQKTTNSKEPAKTTKKASKIIAKKKTFKAKKKVKKYTITLKSGKTPIKKVQVTLKIKGKTYKAKTNAKGKATFKIKKLTKKGKYTAVVKFKGNKNYKASSKKAKITIK